MLVPEAVELMKNYMNVGNDEEDDVIDEAFAILVNNTNRAQNALLLISEIFDNHTENSERDKSYRNCARLFLQVLSDEDVEMEE